MKRCRAYSSASTDHTSWPCLYRNLAFICLFLLPSFYFYFETRVPRGPNLDLHKAVVPSRDLLYLRCRQQQDSSSTESSLHWRIGELSTHADAPPSLISGAIVSTPEVLVQADPTCLLSRVFTSMDGTQQVRLQPPALTTRR